MTSMILHERFASASLDPRLTWSHADGQWSLEDARLVIRPAAGTDYWQKTHYGFAADQGPFLWLPVEADFVLSTHVRFLPAHQYDQAGLMVRLSPESWIKTSVEHEPEGPNRLGVVVTNYGYSDWSTQDFPKDKNEISLRIRREGEDFTVEFAEAGSGRDPRQDAWTQLRITHLFDPAARPVQAGLYACSPQAAGFRAEFETLKIEPQ
jgi:regulation of enolase protein 1 (concanavalin A-like superfamily)